ncbi:uncharacterized protein PG998_002979 [Apiospora kogelbergensis]|uniref:uncharacterized protein n=1 Tax=Apiospora kogelbergensis TaxID=1337665 RepID=UPI00312FD4A0
MEPSILRPWLAKDQRIALIPLCYCTEEQHASPSPTPLMSDADVDELAYELLAKVHRFRYKRFNSLTRQRAELVESWTEYYSKYQA